MVSQDCHWSGWDQIKFLSSLQLQIGENKSAVPEAARVGRADHLKLVTLLLDDPLLPGMLLVMV